MTKPATTTSTFDFDDLDLSWLRDKEGVKWSKIAPDVLPAWIADMDFPVAKPVQDALVAAIHRGDLGYPAWSNWAGPNPLAELFADRMNALHGWRPQPDWVRNFSDIIQVIQVVLHVMTAPGDAVAIQTPSYPPFLKTIELMNRRVVANSIERFADGWGFDVARLETAVVDANVRVLIIVNPHNPTGRVFTRRELEALAEVAVRNDLIVLADEVLAELAYSPHRHIPIASLGSEIAARAVTMTSATKAFNFAGLRCAVTHIGPEELRRSLDAGPPDLFGVVNVLGVEATKAAWQNGDEWLTAVRDYLRRNRDLVSSELADGAPMVGYDQPEANYLAWLDCRSLGSEVDPAAFFRTAARVEVSPGKSFGLEGEGFVRLNFATSTAVLTEILSRMTTAVGAHQALTSTRTTLK
jgi:cystathionine beta-lyase